MLLTGIIFVNTIHNLFCISTGDGGNDVSMIQAANVGIGIVGKVSFTIMHNS